MSKSHNVVVFCIGEGNVARGALKHCSKFFIALLASTICLHSFGRRVAIILKWGSCVGGLKAKLPAARGKGVRSLQSAPLTSCTQSIICKIYSNCFILSKVHAV